MNNSFCYFQTSPEIIRPAVMMDVRIPLSLRQVENRQRGIDDSCETVPVWWNRLGRFDDYVGEAIPFAWPPYFRRNSTTQSPNASAAE